MESVIMNRGIKVICAAITLLGSGLILASNVQGLAYGDGTYGTCTYNECGISLSSGGSVSLPVTPASGTTCTVASDTVLVTTGSSTGYNLQLSASSATTALIGSVSSDTIDAGSGTMAAPSALTANTWGYRIDSSGGFGSGPTSGVTNGSIPSLDFAGVPALASPDTVANTSAPASSEATDVWYGICADTSLEADTYSQEVTYTALVN